MKMKSLLALKSLNCYTVSGFNQSSSVVLTVVRAVSSSSVLESPYLHSGVLRQQYGRTTCKLQDGHITMGSTATLLRPWPLGGNQVRCLADAKTVKEKVEKYRMGSFEDIPDPSELSHFKTKLPSSTAQSGELSKDTTSSSSHKHSDSYTLPHPIWTDEQLQNVTVTHKSPEGFVDKLAYGTVQLFRGAFDLFSGFIIGQRNERKWLNRIVFLETVAGVPGMVAAMMRHMRSLRRLQRDQGWIHTLLEEAENERMHLLTALQLRQPSLLFKLSVIGAQGVFVTMFAGSYIMSPKFCHRFVGYLEEEAVKTYTKCLQDIDEGPMKHWQTQAAPQIAVKYWKLRPEATMRDVVLAIRADEAHHRLVNHSLASLKKDEFNPYKPGE